MDALFIMMKNVRSLFLDVQYYEVQASTFRPLSQRTSPQRHELEVITINGQGSATLALRKIRLLGPVEVDLATPDKSRTNKSKQPRFRSKYTKSLLGYLAIERRRMAREYLAAMFWPDEDSAKGRRNLSKEINNLGDLFPECWVNDSKSVEFRPSPETIVDIDEIDELEETGRWQEAVAALAGEFLEGINLSGNEQFETWLMAERERWRNRYETALGSASDELIRSGRYDEALIFGRRRLQIAPWNEETHRNVMKCLVWTGQREAALKQFDLCKQTLSNELGVEPSSETIELHEQIFDSELDLPPSPPPFMTESESHEIQASTLFVGRERELARLSSFLEATLAGKSQVVFVTGGPGRGKTALMDSFTQQALDAHPDLLVARGKCDARPGVGDAYAPFRDVMGMLTGDVEARWKAGAMGSLQARRLWTSVPISAQAILRYGPQLLNVIVSGSSLLARASAADPIGAPWLDQLQERMERLKGRTADIDASQIHEQFSNVLNRIGEQRPLLLFLDDLQWADSASVGFLFHLGRRLSDMNGKILIVCGYRPAEIAYDLRAGEDLLAKVLSEFKRRFGDVWLSLRWAEEAEGRRFVDLLVDSQPNRLLESFRSALFQRTGGHPLFTVELLRTMEESGDLVLADDGSLAEGGELDWQVLPARVEAVIEERIQQLEPQLQEILTVASVEGEEFTAQVLAKVLEVEEASMLRLLAQDLDRQHRLVQEQQEIRTETRSLDCYRFSHSLFQTHLYSRLSRGERRILHRDVAAGLEEVFADDLNPMAAQLAQHFDQAGDQSAAQRYHILAAKQAASVYAHEEVISHYSRALDLGQPNSSDIGSIAQMYRGRALAYGMAGRFEDSSADLEEALEITRRAEEVSLEWQILIDLGRLWTSRDYRRSRTYFEEALNLSRNQDDAILVANSLNWMGNWYANHEEASKANAYHQEAMMIFEEKMDRPNLAKTLDLLGISNLLEGNIEAAFEHYDGAIQLFRELDYPPRLAASLVGRAGTAGAPIYLAFLPVRSDTDPETDAHEAMEIFRQIGSEAEEAWATWVIGLWYIVHGEFGKALESCSRGLKISLEANHREWIVGNRYAIGVLYNNLLAPEKARRELELSLALAQDLGSQYWINHVVSALTKSSVMLGELSAAQRWNEMVITSETPMDTLGRRSCWARKAELALAQHKLMEALEVTDHLIPSAADMEPGRVIPFLWLIKSGALAELGQDEKAISLLDAAIMAALDHGERSLLWQLHRSLADIYLVSQRDSEAKKHFDLAKAIVEELAETIPIGDLRDTFRRNAVR